MGLSNYLPSSRISQSGVCTSTTRPASPYEGQIIYETDTNRVLVYDNAAWVMIADTDQPPGLQLIKSQTVGSAVSSVVVSDVFSSDFDNYRILISTVDISVNGESVFLTLSGVSGSVYKYNFQYATYGSVAFTATGSGGTANGFLLGFGGQTDNTNISVDILGPQLAKQTGFNSASSSETYFTVSGGVCTSTVQSTGFTLTPNASTLTGGTIRVYGYRNS